MGKQGDEEKTNTQTHRKAGLGLGSLMETPRSVDAQRIYNTLLSKEVGLLCTAERESVLAGEKESLGRESTTVVILLDNSWTHCQHLHLDWEGRLCHFPWV